MAARVSVIINTYNRAPSLRRTLESLGQLEYPAFEVVVVNGPSTDDTEGLLKEYAGRIKVGHCENRNLSESRNIGIRLAAGEFVAFIDDDAYPDPAWLDRLVEGFDEEEVAAVGGPVYDHTGATLQARYSLATRLGDARVSSAPNPTEYLNVPFTHEFVYTIGTNSAFRYDRLVSIGGFDEEFEYYMDETDVCCRLIDQGFVVRALDDGFVYHKFLESDVRTPNRAIRSRFSVLKNKCYFALKHGLQTHSFYEVCQNLVEGVERSRADFRWNVEHGLLTDDDLAQFERDAHHGFNVALRAFQSGQDRTRPVEWFADCKPRFERFRPIRLRDEKLHVCFFSQEYPPGPVNGIGRFVHTLATGLAADGHLVRVLTSGESHDRVDLEDGVWVHRVRIREHSPPESLDVPAKLWDYSASLLDELRRISAHRAVDVVQAPNWDLEAIAVLLDGSFKTVLSLHTPLATVRRVDPALVGGNPHVDRMVALDRFCIDRADALLANGSSVIEAIEADGAQTASHRVAVIPHGLPDRQEGHGRKGRTDDVRLLFVGRLEKRKGIDTVLAAAPALVQEFPNMTITVVGNDGIPTDSGLTYRERFESSSQGAAAGERIVFTGLVDEAELERLYADCDVFVAPSRFESFGLVLVEAMMFGKPVVAGDNGGMRAVVEDGENGYLVPPDDPEALISAIRRLASSPDRREAFGNRSRQLFEERFTLARMVADTTRFYHELVGRKASTETETSIPPRSRPVVTTSPPTLAPPRHVPDGSPDLCAQMRCPVCHTDLRVDGETVTEDGRLKTGRLVCLRCQVVAAEVNHFKFDFHSRRPGVPVPPIPLVVPALGERRVGLDDEAVTFVGRWKQEGAYRLSEGRVGDALVFQGHFTDAMVRLLRHSWSGLVDLFLDDQLVASVDLYMPEGSQVEAVPLASDLPFGTHTIAVRPRGAAHPDALGSQVLVEEIVLLGPKEAGFADPLPINLGNPFPPRIEQALVAMSDTDLILECGGGDRRRSQRNHLNFEYLKFELADIYGDIHSVPFKDDTFDLVFSQAVFEHVRNPFEAAEELIRVTRPGGTIITEVAFLQPLHAVPYHFFNMTTWGVEELFKSCTILESDWFGDLSVTVDWLLRSVNLPGKVPDERLRGIVDELRELDKFVTHDELKAVASGVYIVARKDPEP